MVEVVAGTSRLYARGTVTTYRRGRICTRCRITILSVYNSTTVCGPCSRAGESSWHAPIHGPDGYPLRLSLLELRILYILESQPCRWLRLSAIIQGVSRRRVGERVRHLRSHGWVIHGDRQRGYMLAGCPRSQGQAIYGG